MSEHDKLLKKIVEAKLALYEAQVRREKRTSVCGGLNDGLWQQ